MSTDFGARLKKARKLAKLTQEQLSKLAGIQQPTLSVLENAGFGSNSVASLARACGVSAYWLETGEGEMKPAPGSFDAIETAAMEPDEDAPYITPGDYARGLVVAFAKQDEGLRNAIAALITQALAKPETASAMAGMIDSLAPPADGPSGLPPKQLPSARSSKFAGRPRQSGTSS